MRLPSVSGEYLHIIKSEYFNVQPICSEDIERTHSILKKLCVCNIGTDKHKFFNVKLKGKSQFY